MGRYAQASRRGSDRTARVPSGPTIVFDTVDTINWTWSLRNPGNWIIEGSLDGLTGWTDIDGTAGSNRSYSPTPGIWLRIRGEGQAGEIVTQESNAVNTGGV